MQDNDEQKHGFNNLPNEIYADISSHLPDSKSLCTFATLMRRCLQSTQPQLSQLLTNQQPKIESSGCGSLYLVYQCVLFVWGRNDKGQLGLGDNKNYST